MSNSIDAITWWNSLRHTGLLLDRKRLQELFPSATAPEIAPYTAESLREALELGRSTRDARDITDLVLTRLCGFEDGWLRGPQIPTTWSRVDRDRVATKPARLWQGPHGATVPIFFDADAKKLGLGKGRRSVSRVLRWMRAGKERLAVLTNGRQWRILHAGLDHDASCESDSDLWFEDGHPAPQLLALAALLSPALWTPAKDDAQPPLLAAIEASRKGQADLSAALGERVRQAVEKLVDAHQLALDKHATSIPPEDIYRAAVRMVMRLVVVLFAEARGLLPVDNTIYHASYGLRGLQDDLRKLKRACLLADSRSAWPRLLALFRLVHDGSPHQDLPVTAYGGELFEPGDDASEDGMKRAIAVFETACFDGEQHGVPDTVVLSLLENLTTTRERVRQGRATVTVPVPVDFSDLSSEYIGILYEGVLDYELKQVQPGDVALLLPIGQQPILPLSRLEAMTEKQLKDLTKEFSKKAKAPVGDGDDSGEADEEAPAEETGDEEPEEDPPEESQASEISDPADPTDTPATEADLVKRATAFFSRFVENAELVKKPTGKLTPEKKAAYAEVLKAKALTLARCGHYPGKRYLVRWGGTRKGSGTFYTRPGLSGPTITRTLAPLAYIPPTRPDGTEDRDAPLTEWTPRKPEEILALKVCDPGAGSGTFPVGSLRFLAQALWESVHYHGRIASESDHRTKVVLYGESGSDESTSDEFLPCSPDDERYEARLRALLKRHVAERCIYGVDLDPLAVELCRLSLWIETLDRDLPFTFLNHKIKCGNSLVGCWFDRFQEFPALCLHRPGDDAGDKAHKDGAVHFAQGQASDALKSFRDKQMKPALARWLQSRDPGMLSFIRDGESLDSLHEQTLKLFEEMHAIPVHLAEERAAFYRDRIQASHQLRGLKDAFDTWCALWFWPADQLDHIPMPESFSKPSEESLKIIRQLTSRYRFFHWELEFPDVFTAVGSGFHAMLGNPPWEVQKPNSKEFFSNIDPLYRTYGKQEALGHQRDIFMAHAKVERDWLDYMASFKSLSNWCANAAFPWGDPADNKKKALNFEKGKGNDLLHSTWRTRRAKRHGFSDALHPFRHQGSADLNSYKLFLEQAHALLGQDGRLGLIVPSNVYTDLRKLFLDRCQWEWIFSFENREKIFDIHRSFKFCALLVQKGGTTRTIRTAFMRRNLADWESGEVFALDYTRQQVEKYSKSCLAFVEMLSIEHANTLEKVYSTGVLLGNNSPEGWGAKYFREFDMAVGSKFFDPRPYLESQGFAPDEYGNWLKGNWKPLENGDLDAISDDWKNAPWLRSRSILTRPAATVLSRDGGHIITLEDVSDCVYPLYEGVMTWQFDSKYKSHLHGSNAKAVWGKNQGESGFKNPSVPQYLIHPSQLSRSIGRIEDYRLVFRSIQNATNQRTFIMSLNSGHPTGNSQSDNF